MNYDTFKERIEMKLMDDYPFTKVVGNSFVIIRGQSSIKVIISELYHQYQKSASIEGVYKDLVHAIEKTFDDRVATEEVNWNNVYPVFKHPNFSHEQCVSVVQSFELDLSTMLVEEGNGIVEILTDEQVGNVANAYSIALENLGRIAIDIQQILPDYRIFSVNPHFPFATSLLLDKRLLKHIDRHIRKDFLFAIPGLSTLIIAEDRDEYFPMLQSLIEKCEDPNHITQSIYRYKGGRYNYAKREHHLRRVK